MNMTVVNRQLAVGDIRIIGVSSGSVFVVGDARRIICASVFDTPPESVIVGPIQPLQPETEQAE